MGHSLAVYTRTSPKRAKPKSWVRWVLAFSAIFFFVFLSGFTPFPDAAKAAGENYERALTFTQEALDFVLGEPMREAEHLAKLKRRLDSGVPLSKDKKFGMRGTRGGVVLEYKF